MNRGVSVTSFRALEELDLALARFVSESEEALQSIEPEINRKLELLSARRAQCEADVEYWQQAYDEADPEEDDVSYLSYRLSQAEDRLANVGYWQSRVDDLFQHYTRDAQLVVKTVIDESPRARAFIQHQLSALRDYINLKPDAAADLADTGGLYGGNLPSPNESPPTVDIPLDSIKEIPLPAGFSWVSLDSIDPAELDQLQGLSSKNDSTPAVLKSGFEILHKTILPEIKAHRDRANSDYFWKLGNGQFGINSLQGVYDAFFGTDQICVDRYIGQQHFGITNGRHRIKAARELGWPAVPARVTQARLRGQGL